MEIPMTFFVAGSALQFPQGSIFWGPSYRISPIEVQKLIFPTTPEGTGSLSIEISRPSFSQLQHVARLNFRKNTNPEKHGNTPPRGPVMSDIGVV